MPVQVIEVGGKDNKDFSTCQKNRQLFGFKAKNSPQGLR